ncbi:MAG: glycosyltransferase family 39 protein [Proteobacteria bacterium]|nr:glycosyltransferase family 39 protein [Pseudomonadota bacterium]
MTNEKRAETACLLGVLALAAVLRFWRLEANGFGTEYYAAGVRSMLQSGWLFFYNAFDPAGMLSLDKPPVAFWIQTLFASVLGFSGWTIHLPQALAGVASVALLHRLVLRPFGPTAALIAALLLALTPIAVAIDRSNNTDSWLVFFLLLAAWTAMRGRGLALVAAMAVLGVAFNVKMLAALVCGPALLAAWWLSGTLDWRARLGWMMAAGATLVVVGLSWAVVFDLTPRADRPFAGSTRDNSMLQLIVVHNGLERFALDRPQRAPANPEAAAEAREMYDAVPVGPLRLAAPTLAGQFGWMLPLALLGFGLAAGFRRRRDQTQASLALWGLWALAYGIVFSAAGGIFHAYYLSALGPPLAALAGIGCVQMWRRGPHALALGLALCGLWQVFIAGQSLGWTSTWIGFPAVAVLAAAGTLWRGKRPPAAIGGFALLILPLAWSMSTLFAPGNHTLPSASLARWLGRDDGRGPLLSRNYTPLSDDPKLLTFLTDNRNGARFLVAAPTTQLAAPIIVRTGQPALAFGGYLGRDPILSPEAFAALAGSGEVRYVLLYGGRARQPAFARWVREHGTPIDPALWRTSPPGEDRRPIALYELKR